VPASSKTDLPLAKAKPVSDSGSTSVITYLRRGKKAAGKRQLRERSERNNSADTKVSEEGGGGCAPGIGVEFFPLQPVMKIMVRQVVSLQSMEVDGGADIHLWPVEGTPHWSR